MPELLTTRTLSSALSRTNPFPGLRPYEEADANWFFGRGGEINELLKRLGQLHLIAVVGASGSGKSSIVRAGVLPQIRDGYLDAEWTIATFRPGERPIANLAEAMCGGGSNVEDFKNTLHSGPLGLVRAILGQELPRDGKVLILVDQFEELFQFARRTGDSAQEEVKEFLKLLLAAANSDFVDVYVVLTMRLEWLNECASYPGLAEAINEGIYLVPQMTRRQFQQAILGPLEAAGGSITTALLGRMLNDLDNKTDQLPVLQHALMRIWERRGVSDAFGSGDYEAVGTFTNCLSAHAEEVYAELDERGKKVAELLFRNITQVYQNRKIRRPQPVGEIARAARVGVEELAPVIQAFSRAGRSFLVTTQGALRPESIVDVSHEALIRQWVRLCGWVEDEADRQGRVSRLETDAAEWDKDRARFRESLYAGYELQRAEELRPSLDPSSTALAFLNESRRERVQRRLIRRGSITLALLLLFAFALVFFRQRAEVARQEAKAQLAVAEKQREHAEDLANIASLQVKKAQEFQEDLVKKIDASNGSATEALAEIKKDIQDHPVNPVVGVTATVSPNKITQGGKATLSWQSTNASEVQIDGVGKEGPRGSVTVTPQATTTYRLVAKGDGGLSGTTTIRVDVIPVVAIQTQTPTQTTTAVPRTITISADVSSSKVTQGGSVKLSWQSANASEVVIDGLGTQVPTGSVTVTPQQTTTYRFTAKGDGGGSASTQIEVQVTPAPAKVDLGTVPELPPDPSPASELKGIQLAVQRYQEAYESESVDDVRKAWPSVSKNDQKNMKNIFGQFNAIRLNVSCQEVRIQGSSATATCRLAYTYSKSGQKLPEQATTNFFRFKKAAEGWVIDEIK